MRRLLRFLASLRHAEQAAFAPLVDAALALDPADIPAFLDDLRRDAPTVAARLADVLARTALPEPGSAPVVATTPRPTPVSMPRPATSVWPSPPSPVARPVHPLAA